MGMASTIKINNTQELLGLKGLEDARALYNQREQTLLLDTKELFALKEIWPVLLESYLTQMAGDYAMLFYYMTMAQKKAAQERLRFTYFLLYGQQQLDASFGRKQCLKDHKESMKKCERLLETLDILIQEGDPKSYQCQLTEELNESPDKPAKYLGLTILARWLADRIMEVISPENWLKFAKKTAKELRDETSYTGLFRDWMSQLNEKRLYWVWGGGLLSSVLAMIPDDFYNKTTADLSLDAIAPYTGYVSWVLYYARFGLNLFLLLKHTIDGSWMEEEETELDLDAWERFQYQWKLRKFALLNDSIWGTANLVCFFWLVGPGLPGYMGNVATALLLFMDLSLAAWRFYEESTEHNKRMKALKEAREALGDLIKPETPPDEITAINQKIAEIQKIEAHATQEWRYKKYALINDLAYATGLLLAFAVAVCFFFPPTAMAPAAVMIIGLVGAALCFVLNATYAAIAGGLEIAKTRAQRAELKKELTKIEATIAELKSELLENKTLEVERQLNIHLLMQKDIQADIAYNNKMIRYQSMHLVRSIIIDAFVPFLVFSGFVFMPLGIGLGIMGAGFAIAVFTNFMINQFKPNEEEKSPELKSDFFQKKKDYEKDYEIETDIDAELQNEGMLPTNE